MLHPSWIEDLLDDEHKHKQHPSPTSSDSESPSSSSSSYLWSEPHTTMPFPSAPTPSPQDLWAVANALQTATMQTAALQKIAQLLSSASLLSTAGGWPADASVTAHQLASSPPLSAGLALPRDDPAALLGVNKPVASWMVDKNTLETYLQQYASHLVGILDEGHKTELMRGGTAVTVFLVMHLLRHMEPQGWVSKNVAHPAKYLTTSIKNLRAALCSNPLVSTLLSSVWELRPDIAMWVDGKTLHYIADHLASEQVAVECLACLSDALPVGWSISMPNQRATVLSTIKHFFAVKYHLGNLKPQQMSPMVPFAQLA